MSVAECLPYLLLTGSVFPSFPFSVGQLVRLERLSISGNLLTRLPETIGSLRNVSNYIQCNIFFIASYHVSQYWRCGTSFFRNYNYLDGWFCYLKGVIIGTWTFENCFCDFTFHVFLFGMVFFNNITLSCWLWHVWLDNAVGALKCFKQQVRVSSRINWELLFTGGTTSKWYS